MTICEFLRRSLTALLASVLAVPLSAQDTSRPRKNTFAVGAGVGIPAGDLRQFMSLSGAIRLKYGYRFTRNLQADVGLDAVIGAAGIDISQQTPVGELRIRDVECIVPMGGRAILPLAADWLELFAGGGVVYLRYSEYADLPDLVHTGYVDVPCPGCTARSGWGFYGTAGINIALERRKRIWLGMEAQYIAGTTSGKLLGTGARFETKDRWLNTAMNLVFRF